MAANSLTPAELIELLTLDGFSLSLVDDKIRCTPTPESALIELLQKHKAAVMMLLTNHAAESQRVEPDQALITEAVRLLSVSSEPDRQEIERALNTLDFCQIDTDDYYFALSVLAALVEDARSNSPAAANVAA
jgi:hypothetical protein